MEFLYRIKHYTRKFLLAVLGPAQLDDEHDPGKIEDREYAAHRAERRARAAARHEPPVV